MFAATYLTWQSWLFTADDAALLVDPLLFDHIGRGEEHTRNRMPFWPPRSADWRALPPVDAVVITHEHDDHFNLPSLARIDRRIPIYLSDRTSAGAAAVLREMGFDVRPLMPASPLRFGSLELRSFRPSHIDLDQLEEWDTQAFFVRHTGGEGQFFTPVDVTIDAAVSREVAALSGASPLFCFEQMKVGRWQPDGMATGNHHKLASQDSFVSGEQALRKLRGGDRVGVTPGQTLVWRAGELSEVRDEAPFVRTLPRDQWPPMPQFWGREGDSLVPCCGERSLDEQGWADIEAGLDELAAFLYGREHFRLLLSLDERALDGRKPTLLLMFLNSPASRVYAYDIAGRRFQRVRVTGKIQDEYVGHFGCWATDFAALLRGDFDPRSVVGGVTEEWAPEVEARSFFMQALWPFFHPLNRPAQCLRQYRVAAQREASAPTLVRPRDAQSGLTR